MERILTPGSDRTLVEQIVDWYAARIDERLLRPGSRMPSVRQFAAGHGVSRFTVVEAYDRLIARGYLESRRGSGFYVRDRGDGLAPRAADAWAEPAGARIDIGWLLRNMFRKLPPQNMPGGGVLPADWLDADIVASGLRALGLQVATPLLDYGDPQGFGPLRERLRQKLAEFGIGAGAHQILTTNGVSQALDLIAQHFLKPGDTVLVDEPSWFLMFGRMSLLGARIIGVPRGADGPDLDRLQELAQAHRPKLFVTVSVLHNPTSTAIAPAVAYRLLQLAERFDFTIVEDDVYGDLHPGPAVQPCLRLAGLDQLQRVVYLGGFSKTLAASLRVGFVACEPGLARALTDLKMLVGLTSPELGERLVHRVLSEGQYRRHLDRLRARLAAAHEPALRAIERLGMRPFATPGIGMFLWADAGVDTTAVAQAMHERGYLMAPGSLFMPDQRPSTWMRFNVATTCNPRMLAELDEVLGRVRARAGVAGAGGPASAPAPAPAPAPARAGA